VGSQVRGRKVDKSIRARASGYPVCQPVRLTFVVQNIRAVPAEKSRRRSPSPDSTAEKNFSSEMYFAPQHAVDVEAAELDLFDFVFRERLLDLLGIHACHVAAAS